MVVFEGEDLWNLQVAGDRVYVEQAAAGGPTTVLEVAPRTRPRPVDQLAVARPHRAVYGVEDGELICVEGTRLIALPGRRVLCELGVAPAALAVTPEQVVWCTAATRDVSERTASPGRLWRWWRGSEVIEELGEHGGAAPVLLAATRTPIAGGAITSDVFLAADSTLHVIDVDGVPCLARSARGIAGLACSADALYYLAHNRVMQRSLATGDTRIVARATIPMALAVEAGQLAMTSNVVWERGRRTEEAAVTAIELATGEGRVLARGAWRPTEVAADARGMFVIAKGEPTDQLLFVPWDAPVLARVPAVAPLDPQTWESPLTVQWWLRDGRAGFFTIDRDGTWQLQSGERPETGAADLATRLALERWHDEWLHVQSGWIDFNHERGWLVSWGLRTWSHSEAGGASLQAEAIGRLCELIAARLPACHEVASSRNTRS